MSKHEEFKKKIHRLEDEQTRLKAEHQTVWNTYNKKLSAFQDLESLGEGNTPKAKALKDRFKDHRDIKEIVARTPDSRIHNLADETFQEIAKAVDIDQKRVERFTAELAKLRDQYLKIVTRIGESYRRLYEDAWQTRELQEYLPPEKQTINPPAKAPYCQDFEIDENMTAKAYGQRPMWIE